jgi:hypothetical protein
VSKFTHPQGGDMENLQTDLQTIIKNLESKIQFQTNSRPELIKNGALKSYLIPADIIIAMDIQLEWLVEKLLPEKAITILYGPSGIGKSSFVFALIKGLFQGDFLGLKTKKPPCIVYIDSENPAPFIIGKINKLNINYSELFIWSYSLSPNPPIPLDAQDYGIYHQIPSGALIVFDTLKSLHSSDENSSKDMGVIFERLKQLRKDKTLLIIHHTNKSNAYGVSSFRGSSFIKDSADHFLKLEEDEEGLLTLSTEKSRFAQFSLSLFFDQDTELFEVVDNLETVTLLKLQTTLKRKGPLHFSKLFEIARENLNIKSKAIFSNLLKTGIKKGLWRAKRVDKRVMYEAVEKTPEKPVVVEANINEENIKRVSTTTPIFSW